jgi:predicted ATPase
MIAAAFNPLEAEAASPIRSLTRTGADLPGAEQLTLAPLTVTDICELLRLRFDVEIDRVGDFAAFLHSRTLGNPFFVEETIKTLIERGSLRRVHGRWIGWDVEEVDVPATIREVLLERVNALSAPARAIAELAAVVGARVSHDLLRSTKRARSVRLHWRDRGSERRGDRDGAR